MSSTYLGIVKLSSLGDILQSAMAVRDLKRTYPHLHITWIVDSKNQELVECFDFVDKVIAFDGSQLKKGLIAATQEVYQLCKILKNHPFDVVIDMQGNSKSALVTLCCKAPIKIGFNASCVAEFPNLLVTNRKVFVDTSSPCLSQYAALLRSYFGQLPQQSATSYTKAIPRKIMVCFGSNWENKKLSLDQLSSLLQHIENTVDPEFTLVVGAKKELDEAIELKHRLTRVSICEKPSWKHWMELMKQMDLVISADSCALHLAGFLDMPTLSYFGPSSMKVYKPLGEHHQAIQGSCPYNMHFSKRCPRLRTCHSGACLKRVDENMFKELHSDKVKILDKLDSFYVRVPSHLSEGRKSI